jgi:3-oxoacyl-[acyl-carrier protein] reductase
MGKELKLDGRVALVTGAGRGIGRAIAVKLAAEGALVVVNDIQLSFAESTARRISEAGQEALAIQTDVSNDDEVLRMFELVGDRFGRVDILVNNAGIRRDSFLNSMTADAWDKVVSTSLKGSFNCCRAAAKYMIKQNSGKILNISSHVPPCIAGRGNANYSAANAGLEGFTKALAVELGPHSINVNCIAPDFIDTEMTRASARSEGLYLDDLKKFGAAGIPLKRLGKPSDVANLAAFLLSDDSSFITGQIISIKGGP